MKKSKYLITKQSPILFNELLKHSIIATNALSAGFFYTTNNKDADGGFDVVCYGESASLNVQSNPECDSLIIKKILKGEDSYGDFINRLYKI